MDLLIPRLHSAQCATEGTDAPVEWVAHRSSPSADPAALPRPRQLNCLTPSIEDVDGASRTASSRRANRDRTRRLLIDPTALLKMALTVELDTFVCMKVSRYAATAETVG